MRRETKTVLTQILYIYIYIYIYISFSYSTQSVEPKNIALAPLLQGTFSGTKNSYLALLLLALFTEPDRTGRSDRENREPG